MKVTSHHMTSAKRLTKLDKQLLRLLFDKSASAWNLSKLTGEEYHSVRSSLIKMKSAGVLRTYDTLTPKGLVLKPFVLTDLGREILRDDWKKANAIIGTALALATHNPRKDPAATLMAGWFIQELVFARDSSSLQKRIPKSVRPYADRLLARLADK